jgi:hypothetical protein
MSVINRYLHEAPEDEVDELIANNNIDDTQLDPNSQRNTAPSQEEEDTPADQEDVQVDDDYLQQDPEEDPNAGAEEGMEEVPPEEEPPSEIQQLDNNMFGDLSATELAARDRKLRQDMATLYDLCNVIMNRVIFINKNESIIKVSEYITGKMEDMKDRLVDYLNYIYDSKSYIENLIYYKQCYSVLEGIALILKEIEPKEENK